MYRSAPTALSNVGGKCTQTKCAIENGYKNRFLEETCESKHKFPYRRQREIHNSMKDKTESEY